MRILCCAIIWLALSQQAIASPPQTADELMENVRRTAEYNGMAMLCGDSQTSVDASSHFRHLVNVALLRWAIPIQQEPEFYRAYGERGKSFYTMLQTQQKHDMHPPADACQDNAAGFIIFKVSTAYDLSKDPRMAEALQALNGRIAGGYGSDDPKLAKAYAILQERTSDIGGPGVNDSYDLLKSNPLIASALSDAPTSNPNSGRSLGWADGIGEGKKKASLDPASTVLLAAFILCLVVVARNLSKVTPVDRYEGTLSKQGKPRWWVLAALSFVSIRGFVDLYVGVSSNNALNLLFGIFGIGCALLPFIEKYRARFLLLTGYWMLARGILSIFIIVWMTDGLEEFLEFLTTMPISVLPNVLISYVLPILIGVHFLRLHKATARLAGK